VKEEPLSTAIVIARTLRDQHPRRTDKLRATYTDCDIISRAIDELLRAF
jgi:hypothetical protein